MDDLEQEKMLNNIQQNTISLNNAFSSIAKYDVINTATVVNINTLTNQSEINSFPAYTYSNVIEQPKLPIITSSPIQLDASNIKIQSSQYVQSSHYISADAKNTSFNFIIQNNQTNSNENPILNTSMNAVQQQKLQQQTH